MIRHHRRGRSARIHPFGNPPISPIPFNSTSGQTVDMAKVEAQVDKIFHRTRFDPTTEALKEAITEALFAGSDLGVFSTKSPEDLFKEDWEGDYMRRWTGSIDKDTAKVWVDDNKGVLVAKFPYRASVIQQFKEKIPTGKKAWNPDTKTWEFSAETIDVLMEILTSEFGDNVIDLTQQGQPVPQSPSLDPLLSLLDNDDIQKIYLMLVKKYHPDIGGDGDKMARINQIFNQRKEMMKQ